jgi:hypothetical protein
MYLMYGEFERVEVLNKKNELSRYGEEGRV